ncbi:hypothetical protein FA13DRAFT_1743312 [Coprinellus micaceus]|uniref:Uncharacterized protein n=1 Tax=Coprinellus micaceus TaxID=71717 RepID=A0A4Y7SFB7_COPMI|nr:hypothetical protein FA13DRAFT_1743312 [Coprinellus micaceus]
MGVYGDILVLGAQGNLVSVLGAGVIEGHLLMCLPPFHFIERLLPFARTRKGI